MSLINAILHIFIGDHPGITNVCGIPNVVADQLNHVRISLRDIRGNTYLTIRNRHLRISERLRERIAHFVQRHI